MRYVFTTLLVLAGIAGSAVAQYPGDCPNGQCPNVRLEWRLIPKAPEQRALFRGGIQLGAFSFQTKVYRPLLSNGSWGNPAKPPVAPPEAPKKAEAAPIGEKVAQAPTPVSMPAEEVAQEPDNYGINLSAMQTRLCTPYCLNGKSCSRDDVCNALAKGEDFPDDSGKLRATAIGSAEFRNAVRNDLKSTGLLSTVNFTDYAPDSPMVACGFLTDDQFYVQNSADEVLHRERGNPSGSSQAIRKVNPNYEPKKDPNVNAPAVAIDPLEYVKTVYGLLPPWGWICVGLGGYYLYNRNKKATVAK